MTLDEYQNKLKELVVKQEQERNTLKIQYAKSNNTVKIGDIVEDRIGKIRVEKIIVYYSDPPSCVYEGIEQLKNGGDTKKMKRRHCYQINLKTGE